MSINTPSIPTYNFYNHNWFIAADVVKHYKLSTNYNTYYSKYYSNSRLFGPTPSFEFRLSGTYLEEFKRLYGGNNPSINKTNAIWLIDEETTRKLLNKELNDSKEKTVKTIESNSLSVHYHLDDLGVKDLVDNKESVVFTQDKEYDLEHLKQDLKLGKFSFTSDQLLPEQQYKSSKEIIPFIYSKYSEEDISDAITLISSKLTNSPYQQEKILDGGSIRLDLFTCTRRSVYAVELKKNLITLTDVKEKLDNKNYLKHIINAYPDLNITFIFSSPKGISFEALMYLQEASRSIGEHKIIYKPTSNLLLDMINKKEKDLPSYYYKQILDKPIIKYLLQVE